MTSVNEQSPSIGTHIDRLVDVLTGAASPADVARELAVTEEKVFEWCARLTADTPFIKPNQAVGFTAVQISHTVGPSRLLDDQRRLHYRITVRNLSRARFHGVRILQRSFTDETLLPLSFEEPWTPGRSETPGVLEPGGVACFQASYLLNDDQLQLDLELRPELEIVNAVAVLGVTAAGSWFRIEEDSVWPPKPRELEDHPELF